MNKDKIVEFLNDKNTYNTIMGILDYKLVLNNNKETLTDYPTHSFIAGGAIANTIYYLLNKNKFDSPIINDIDLFCINNTHEPYQYFSHPENENFIHTTLNENINIDGYGRVWRGSCGESLSMVSSNRFGVLNEVKIDVSLRNDSEFNEVNYYLDILKVFDLNCCSAGIDRVNEKIIYTDKFVDFLLTNRIEVTSIAQPLQTTYRLHKKIEELKTDKSNLDIEMSLIQHSCFKSNRNWIGPEWLAKLKNNNKLFHKYFEGGTNDRHTPYDGAKSYHIKDFKLQKYVSNFNFYILDNNSIITFWDLFIRRKNIKNYDKVLTFYQRVGKIKKESVLDFIKSLLTKKKPIWFSKKDNDPYSTYVPIRQSTSSDLCILTFLSECPNYLDCDFTISDLHIINNFNTFLNNNFIINSSIFLVDNVKDHIKMVSYVYKRFIKNGIFRKELFSKVVLKQEKLTKISSLNYDEKVKSIEKILNDLWIKDYHNGYPSIKHSFIERKKLNTIDFDEDCMF
jgi:hypothetical protein